MRKTNSFHIFSPSSIYYGTICLHFGVTFYHKPAGPIGSVHSIHGSLGIVKASPEQLISRISTVEGHLKEVSRGSCPKKTKQKIKEKLVGWTLHGWPWIMVLEMGGDPNDLLSGLILLGVGWTTHLKNMLIELDHFPNFRTEHKKYVWNHHLEYTTAIIN